MLTLTTETGHTLTADTDVELAALWADHDNGEGWDDDLSPFDEHTIMGGYIDAVYDAKAGAIAGCRVSEG
ncbi:hypothetical protein [Microbacterium telephonicum]|uniref:Uncharacterized protein n=1 Tax=Microbacterium telephonicum TaxID=1714841 RepID=A0A498BR21_9MICO|nr:hypothetical protein [Microbacterium telephonicum]RLK46425.1 hypothetical protein C7474_2963 [Microbacterium telephonicum]